MTNFEIKVKIEDKNVILCAINNTEAVYVNKMHHIDYYFNVGIFKEKIREIDKSEIQQISYSRVETSGRKESKYEIKSITQKEKNILLKQNEVLCTIDKERKLWIYKNTRIHLDKVNYLGYFLELETVIKNISNEEGKKEFNEVIDLLKVNEKDTVAYSYSDLILMNQKGGHQPVWSNKYASI